MHLEEKTKTRKEEKGEQDGQWKHTNIFREVI